MMLVFVEEEYGYRSWLWEYPGTPETLVTDFKSGRFPSDFFDPSEGAGEAYPGTMTQVDMNDEAPPIEDDPRLGAFIHTHEWDDTYLLVGGKCYHRDGRES